MIATRRLTPDDMLLVLLEPRPPRRVRRWLYDGLRAAIRSGRLEPATVLPSSRAAAAALGVARGTVTEAVDLLIGEGFLEARDRSGVVVAARGRPVPGRSLAIDPPPPASPGLPDPALFPRAGWARAARHAALQATDQQLGYPDPQGLPGLRTELAGLLRRTRGAQFDPDQMVVVGGVAQALTLIGGVLAARGTRMVAVEEPGPPGVWGQLTGAGLTLSPTPVDSDGLMVDRLDPAAGAVLVTPAHQYPIGTVLAAHRRRALVDWATHPDRLILEDDYDAELRYDRSPVAAVQGMAPDRVLLLGSLSKTLSPALRLGWIVSPGHLVDEIVAGKRQADLGNSTLEQLALEAFLAGEDYQRHLRRARQHYQHRRAELLDSIREVFPRMRITGGDAGLHLVLHLPDQHTQTRAVTALRAHGVATQPLSVSYQLTPRYGAIIGAARTTAAQIGDAAADLTPHPPPQPRDALR